MKNPSVNLKPNPLAHNYSKYGLPISLGVTALLAILNSILLIIVLSSKSSFILYTISRRGSNTLLLDTPEVAVFTSIVVASSIVITCLVLLLCHLKSHDWVRLIILLQVGITGIILSSFVGSVAKFYNASDFFAVTIAVAVILATIVVIVKYEQKVKL
jgi:hypothetical protein